MYAHEQSGVLKSLLYTMLPTCKIYLDEDDNDEDDEVEAQVEQASALLVFLTIEYVGSRKGMLELTTARRLQKPLIVVRETDVRYGGLSARAFEAEVKLHVARHLSGMNEDEQAALAWLQSAANDGARRPLGFQTLLFYDLPPQVPRLTQGSSGTARSSSSTPCCARLRSSCTTTRPVVTRSSARGLAASARQSRAP